MLVRDERITEAQLTSAVAQQRKVGGRMGTVMVEMGLIDLDTLTVYLGLELGIPIASGQTLERAKKLAVRLLAPEQAAHYRVVPLLIHDRQLIAAVDDPHDMQAFDELLRITGYRIVPRVAPEIRIFYYLERYYGVARPPRFMVFGDAARGNQKPADDLPAPPLPGLPPVDTERVPAPRPAPPLRTVVSEEDDYEELDLDDTELLVELEADETDAAGEAPLTSRDASREIVIPTVEEETYEPISLEAAVEAMGSADGRNEIATSLMAHAAGLFDLVALCIVRDNMAFGWKVHSSAVDQDRIETLLVPLAMPSMFQSALASDDQSFTGAPFPATLHNYMFKVLRTPTPTYAVVHAITIGKRVVNILYAHRQSGVPLSDDENNGLARLCDAATAAYIRMIASSKRRRRPTGKRVAVAAGDDEAESETPAPPRDGDGEAARFTDDETMVGKRSARKSGKSPAIGDEEDDD